MLYIDDIGNNTIRFGNAAGGGTYTKFLSKPLYAESDLLGRVWIKDGITGINYLNCYDPSQITLDGGVYEVDDFVSEFNLIGALLNPQPPTEIPDGAITTLNGDYIKTLTGEYITITSAVPEGSLITLSGNFVKTLNDEFITI